MNKVHKIIWSSILNTWVVVSELVSLHKKSSTTSSKQLNQRASITLNSPPLKPVNMPSLSRLALSLCGALLLTHTPAAFAADITSGGGTGGQGLSSGGSGGLAAGGGAGGGGDATAGVGGNGATLTSDAQAGGNSPGSLGGQATSNNINAGAVVVRLPVEQA